MGYFFKGKSPKKSRKGSTPFNVETLIDQTRYDKSKLSSLQFQCFSEALQEKIAEGAKITSEEALVAAKELARRRAPTRHLEAATLGAVATPVITTASRAAKGFVDTPGNLGAKARGALVGAGKATAGDVASHVIGGGLTSGMISAGREGLRLHKAKTKVKEFLTHPRRRGKRKVRKLMALVESQ